MAKTRYIEINQKEFKEFAQLSNDQPVVMLNLLKFKNRVDDTGLSGEESYKHYMKAAMPFFKNANAEVLFFGSSKHMLIGPLEEELWDKILLVKYNSVNDFLGMIKAEGYPAHLRKQALLDSRLIHCKP